MNDDWGPWASRIDDRERFVIASIEAKTNTLFVIDPCNGKRANIGVVRPPGVRHSCELYADSDWNDNLLSRNQCPL
jgi:hypothetical protein